MASPAHAPAEALPHAIGAASAPSRARGSLRRAYGGAFGVSLASKVAGFVRELVIAHAFGATPVASLYFTAVQVPTYVQSFFFGAFALPTVPRLRELHVRGEARAFERRLLLRAAAIVGAAALVGWWAMTAWAAPFEGLGWGAVGLFLAPLFLCCAAIPRAGVAYCDALVHGDTTRASAIPAVMNMSAVAFLAGGYLLFGSEPLVLTVSTALGIFVQARIAAGYSSRSLPRPAAPAAAARPSRYGRGLGLAVLENACFAGAFFWQSQLYGIAAAGGTALFFYAFRLANFPFLLFVAPAQQLVYRRTDGGPDGERRQRALLFAAIVAVGGAAAAGLALLGPPVIRLFYLGGAMTAEACDGVAALAAPLCLSLLAVALIQTAGRCLSQTGRYATYAATVIPTYLLANVARYAAAGSTSLAGTALAGAAVEFFAAGVLATLVLKRSA